MAPIFLRKAGIWRSLVSIEPVMDLPHCVPELSGGQKGQSHVDGHQGAGRV